MKCVIVPLAPFSDELVETLVKWLRKELPAWLGFLIEPYSKYLGFYMGPAVSSESWTRPVPKWRARALHIAGKPVSPIISVAQYNSRAISVLQYVA